MPRKTGDMAADRTVWDLTPLYDSDDASYIDTDRKKLEKKCYRFINAWRDRKDYLEDPAVLKKALDEYERLMRNYGADGNEGYYFWLRTQQDQNSPALKAKYNKIEEFGRRIENDMRFFQMRISKIPRSRQKMLLGFAGLQKYRHFLERSFEEARYLLTESEERIMSLKSSTSYGNWVKMTSGFIVREERDVLLEDGKKGVKTFSGILSLMNSRKKAVRDGAARAFNDILRKHADSAEAEINAILANKKTDDDLRKMSRPDLARHVGDDMESDVVDSLISTVADRYDIPARFYKLKAELLGVKKLKYHERNVEYGIADRKFSFGDAVALVRKVFSGLDGEFPLILDFFLKHGRFDVYPAKGKTSGAFCAHHLISHPTYILLNHTDTLNDVLTLAHELGHGINNELIRRKQHALYFGTPLSTAEVASTFMEDFVLQEIMHEADVEMRLALMLMKLNDDVSTIFRQVACYRFEQELHAEFRSKGYLSKEEIGVIFCRHMASYMGDFVEQSSGSENWWIYWGHIRTFFYVYSYASGLLISKAMQNHVKNDPKFIVKVKSFLSAGLSDSPRNIFAGLGVDIGDASFWQSGIEEIEHLLEETITLAKRLKKIR
ncbi:MAG TPA: M3 family oligoendopeptidase [Dissulfurispiraceae bacterium]|nr:M3 family oligoendopeptidase [Dissulfurispiraceae bacterium]